MSKISEYAQEIPEEIRRAIRGLDSDYRAAIFVALYKHGELSFSDLRKKLRIDKANLYYHLRKLTETALVEHFFKRALGDERYSFYSVTQFGQNFIETLGEFLRPEPLRFQSFYDKASSITHSDVIWWLSNEPCIRYDDLRRKPVFIICTFDRETDTHDVWDRVSTHIFASKTDANRSCDIWRARHPAANQGLTTVQASGVV